MCSEYSAESFYLVKNGRRAPHPVLRIRILLIVRVESSTFFLTLASLDALINFQGGELDFFLTFASLDALVALSSAKILRGDGGFSLLFLHAQSYHVLSMSFIF